MKVFSYFYLFYTLLSVIYGNIEEHKSNFLKITCYLEDDDINKLSCIYYNKKNTLLEPFEKIHHIDLMLDTQFYIHKKNMFYKETKQNIANRYFYSWKEEKTNSHFNKLLGYKNESDFYKCMESEEHVQVINQFISTIENKYMVLEEDLKIECTSVDTNNSDKEKCWFLNKYTLKRQNNIILKIISFEKYQQMNLVVKSSLMCKDVNTDYIGENMCMILTAENKNEFIVIDIDMYSSKNSGDNIVSIYTSTNNSRNTQKKFIEVEHSGLFVQQSLISQEHKSFYIYEKYHLLDEYTRLFFLYYGYFDITINVTSFHTQENDIIISLCVILNSKSFIFKNSFITNIDVYDEKKRKKSIIDTIIKKNQARENGKDSFNFNITQPSYKQESLINSDTIIQINFMRCLTDKSYSLGCVKQDNIIFHMYMHSVLLFDQITKKKSEKDGDSTTGKYDTIYIDFDDGNTQLPDISYIDVLKMYLYCSIFFCIFIIVCILPRIPCFTI
ncbi:hypothetical protein EON71_00375 [bacterium]|nr:MAG: hypothetical protein EON71_00375 [bacterium]